MNQDIKHVINYQLFEACYIETHPFERNVKVNARNEWGKLQLKWKLYNKSRSKWPRAFYVDARTTINNVKYAYELQRRIIANKTKYIRTQEQNDNIRKSLGGGYRDRCLFYSEKEDKYYPATVEHRYSDIDGDSSKNLKIIYDDSKNKSEIVNKSSTRIQPFPINHPIHIAPQSVVAVNNKDHWYMGSVEDIITDKDNKEWIRGIYRQNRKIKSFAIQRYCNHIVLLDDINDFDRLPYSLQSFIKWVQSVQKSIDSNQNVIMKLNWDEIETSLKIQCDKYENFMQELKHLYYNYQLIHHYDRDKEKFYECDRGYFYGCPTIIHYILKNRKIDKHIEDRLKTDGAHIIKLLVKYKIIDGYEQFAERFGFYSCGNGETSTFYELVDDESMIDAVTLICEQQNKAILTITHGTADFKHIFHHWDHEGKLNKNVLDKLIFRGIYPFEFRFGYYAPTYAPTSEVSQKVKQYITQFISEHDVLDIKKIDVYQSCVRSSNHKRVKSTNETCIMVPLVLHPFICQAKKEMFDLLSKCSYFPDIVIEIINSYIYVNYDLFYPKTIHNNLKVKTINLFNSITHMKKQYTKYFLNEMGHDQKLMNYIFDNDKYTEQYLKYFWEFVRYQPYQDRDCHLLYEIIVMNNITINQERMHDILKGVADSGDCKTLTEFLGLAKKKYQDKLDHDKKLMNYIFDNDKYSEVYLRCFWESVRYNYQDRDCHLLYEIIVENNISINMERMHNILKEVAELGDCKTLIDFLGLAKIKYGHKFDVNFIWKSWSLNVDGDIDLMGDLMTSTDYRNEETASATMLYILREFDYNYTQQYSIRLGVSWKYEDLTLLEYMLIRFKNSYAEIMNCLLIECEDKYSYSINDIEEVVLRVLHMIASSNPLMETIGNCLEIRCKTKEDTKLMNNILEKMRQ